MCCNIRFLKCMVGFNAWICTLLGLLALVCGIVVGVNTSGSADAFFQTGGAFTKNSLVACLYVFGIALILLGVFGIVGGKKKNGFCLFIFNIGLLAGLIVFAAIGITASVYLGDMEESSKSSCMTQNWSVPYDEASNLADEMFCQETPAPGCECYIKQAGMINGQDQLYQTQNQSVSTVTQFNQCTNYPVKKITDVDYNFLSAAENTFHCSGWCTSYDYYQFSNINNGQPSAHSACYFEVYDWVHKYGLAIGITCDVIAFLILLALMFTCCLCFHPEKKNQAGTYYTRMAYYDE